MPKRATGRIDPLGKKENKAANRDNEHIENSRKDIPKGRVKQPTTDDPKRHLKGKDKK